MFKPRVEQLTVMGDGREVRCSVEWSNEVDGQGWIGIEVKLGLEPQENESIPSIQARAIEASLAALRQVISKV